MKSLILAAALIVGAGAAPAALVGAADAQHTVVRTTTVRTTSYGHHGFRNVCHTNYRHHHRVRECRRVRY